MDSCAKSSIYRRNNGKPYPSWCTRLFVSVKWNSPQFPGGLFPLTRQRESIKHIRATIKNILMHLRGAWIQLSCKKHHCLIIKLNQQRNLFMKLVFWWQIIVIIYCDVSAPNGVGWNVNKSAAYINYIQNNLQLVPEFLAEWMMMKLPFPHLYRAVALVYRCCCWYRIVW